MTATEREFLDRIAGGLIGDDAAVLTPRVGEDLLVSTDAVVEGVHFRREWGTASEMAVRGLVGAASDIAAMGGEGRYYLSTFHLPPDLAQEAPAIHDALCAAGRKWGFEPAGGDTVRSDRIAFDFTVIGAVPRGGAVRRTGAIIGDALVLTGRIGAARGGLVSLHHKLGLFEVEARFLRPRPRLMEGQRLRGAKAHAMIDVSDGLGMDLDRLARASHVACVIENLPLDPLAPAAAKAVGEDPDFFCLASGEEYALVAAVAQEEVSALAAAGYLVIGRVRAPSSQVVAGAYLLRDGQLYGASASGHDHFR